MWSLVPLESQIMSRAKNTEFQMIFLSKRCDVTGGREVGFLRGDSARRKTATHTHGTTQTGIHASTEI
jgi:hypothetical protein